MSSKKSKKSLAIGLKNISSIGIDRMGFRFNQGDSKRIWKQRKYRVPEYFGCTKNNDEGVYIDFRGKLFSVECNMDKFRNEGDSIHVAFHNLQNYLLQRHHIEVSVSNAELDYIELMHDNYYEYTFADYRPLLLSMGLKRMVSTDYEDSTVYISHGSITICIYDKYKEQRKDAKALKIHPNLIRFEERLKDKKSIKYNLRVSTVDELLEAWQRIERRFYRRIYDSLLRLHRFTDKTIVPYRETLEYAKELAKLPGVTNEDALFITKSLQLVEYDEDELREQLIDLVKADGSQLKPQLDRMNLKLAHTRIRGCERIPTTRILYSLITNLIPRRHRGFSLLFDEDIQESIRMANSDEWARLTA